MVLNSDAEIDNARAAAQEELYKDYEAKWNYLAKKFRDNAMPLSHVLLQLTVEDLLTILIPMWRSGKFDPEEVDLFPTMAMEVTDNLEYTLDWQAPMQWSVDEYLSGIREEKRNAGVKREGSAGSGENSSVPA